MHRPCLTISTAGEAGGTQRNTSEAHNIQLSRLHDQQQECKQNKAPTDNQWSRVHGSMTREDGWLCRLLVRMDGLLEVKGDAMEASPSWTMIGPSSSSSRMRSRCAWAFGACQYLNEVGKQKWSTREKNTHTQRNQTMSVRSCVECNR